MSDLFSDPAAPCVHGGVSKVDTVAGVCKLKAGFCIHLNRQGYIVESGFSPEASGAACEGDADAGVGVDSVSFRARQELYKRRCICVCERKYFSGTSLSKISDNIHALSGLGDSEILAVKHLPCDIVPQFIQRREDGRKSPALVMRQQSGNIFKQQKRWSFNGGNSGDLKKESASCVILESSAEPAILKD